MVSKPYPDDTSRTHWAGCRAERGHHNCAVAEIEMLRALLRATGPCGAVSKQGFRCTTERASTCLKHGHYTSGLDWPYWPDSERDHVASAAREAEILKGLGI